MNHNIIGAAAAFAAGAVIAFINYLISKKVLVKAPEKYSLITVVRQIIQVGFLALTYLLGTKIQFADVTYLLVGAVVGVTVPMFFFTKKLLDLNGATMKNKTEKESETNG